MKWLRAFVIATVACSAAACGRGVSSNPLAGETGGDTATGSRGSSGGAGASGGTGAQSGTSTGGNSGTGGVGCEDACDGPCERCADGVCTGCPDGSMCSDDGKCLLDNGEICEASAECSLNHCVPTRGEEAVCCESRCNGKCEACGSDGRCTAYPATDTSCDLVTCEPDTRCVEYRAPAPHACSEHGECAACHATYTRAGMPCGVGSRCDGKGECIVDGRGRVAAGERHTCIITSGEMVRNGNVVCWGDNLAGQLGAVYGLERVGLDAAPFQVPNLEIDFYEEVWQITAGTQHTCVLFESGRVRCWGSLIGHPFGNVPTLLGTTPTNVAYAGSGSDHRFVDALNTGDVLLPGGDADPPTDPAVQISAAPDGATTCALLSSGNVSCWGYNEYGQLGNGSTLPLTWSTEKLPLVANLNERVVEVRSGFDHTCVLTESGRVQCWGAGGVGQLGYGSTDSRFSPSEEDVYVDVGDLVTGLALGHDHTCALLAGGSVRCWGGNLLGQLGYGHTETIGDNETPAQAADEEGPAGRLHLGGNVDFGDNIEMRQIVALAPNRSTCALSSTAIVRCWGQNDVGELGYGHNLTGATDQTPEELAGLMIGGDRNWGGPVDFGREILALAEGGRCALGTNGALWCWGANDYGQLGVPESTEWSLRARPFEFGPVHWWQ